MSLSVFFLLLLRNTNATAKFIATAKLTETICFADFIIFHVSLMQIYFKYKYIFRTTLIFGFKY